MSTKRPWFAIATCLVGLTLLIWVVVQPGPRAALSAPVPQVQGNELAVKLAALLKRNGYVAIPLQVSDGEIDIAARVNGETLRFYLDTGATDNIVDPPLEKRLKMTSQPSDRILTGPGGASAPVRKLVFEKFEVGGLQARVEAVLSDLSYVNTPRRERKEKPCDGLLGGRFLAPHDAQVNYGSRRLFLRKPGLASSAPEKTPRQQQAKELAQLLKANDYHEVPLSLGKNNLPYVTVKINGASCRFVLDTAAMVSIMDDAVAQRLHLPVQETKLNIGFVAGSTTKARQGHVQAFSVGDVQSSLDAFLVPLSIQNATLKKEGDPPYDGLLGAPFLRAHSAVIDYASAKLFLLERKTP